MVYENINYNFTNMPIGTLQGNTENIISKINTWCLQQHINLAYSHLNLIFLAAACFVFITILRDIDSTKQIYSYGKFSYTIANLRIELLNIAKWAVYIFLIFQILARYNIILPAWLNWL
jgi:hypothetical protein